MRALLAVALLAGMLSGLLAGPLTPSAHGEPAWTTYHRDPARSGADPDAINPITPTFAWQSLDLGAPIWGQPLVLGSRVYVATVGDKIYALEASNGEVLWKRSAGTPVPSGELPCGDITPTVGIVGTPVIDTSTNTLYAVADTWNASTKQAHHVLEGYSLAGGERLLSTRVDPPGSDPKALLQRTALSLDKGKVVFGFGGNDGDCSQYRGAVVSAPEIGGSPSFWQYQPAPPSTSGGAVWGASGPAVDGEGHIFVSTGNPNPPEGQKAETYDYSDSVVELGSSLSRIGNFEPGSWLVDSNDDNDLGSAGVELLPGGLLFQAGKNRMGYLIDEASMGSGAPAVFSQKVCEGAGSFGGDAFAGGVIYIPCTDGVRALTYNQAARTFTALWHGPSDAFGPPIVSGGLVWSIATGGFKGGGTKLYGLDPSTGVARQTETLPSPLADHFGSPSAAGGRLFVASGSTVTAYQIAQLSAAPPTVTKVSPTKGPVSGGTTVTVTGTNFTGATAVKFGSTSARSFTVKSATSITAVSPTKVAGTEDVTVTAPIGTSLLSAKDHFQFTPTVTGLSTTTGSKAGGTSVTVSGTGFALGTTATILKFGSTNGTNVSCSSTTTCNVVAPAHEIGTVDVKATVNKASSPKTSADRFTYN
jgi:hypothetical protein